MVAEVASNKVHFSLDHLHCTCIVLVNLHFMLLLLLLHFNSQENAVLYTSLHLFDSFFLQKSTDKFIISLHINHLAAHKVVNTSSDSVPHI